MSEEQQYGAGCTVVEGEVGMPSIMRGFDCTKRTIMKWMKKLGLPYNRYKGEKRDTIRFEIPKVVKWAQRNGKAFDCNAASG